MVPSTCGYTRGSGPHGRSDFCDKGNISAPTSNKPLLDMERCTGKSLWALRAHGLKIEMELFYMNYEHKLPICNDSAPTPKDTYRATIQ